MLQLKTMLLHLLEHKQRILLEEILHKNTKSFFTTFYSNLFKALPVYSRIILYYNRANNDPSIYKLIHQLMLKISRFLISSPVSKCLHFKENSDMMYDFIDFTKAAYIYDLSYLVSETDLNAQRNGFNKIFKHMFKIIRVSDKITFPYGIEIGNKKSKL